MSFVTRYLVFMAVGLLLAGPEAFSEEKEPQPTAVVLSPAPESAVSASEEIEGKITGKDAWPVLFVRPVMDGEPWWIQPPVDDVAAGGAFAGRIHFGNESTSKGTKFHLVVCAAKNKEQAAKYKAGVTLATLPLELAAADPIVVYRDARPADSPARQVRSIDFAGRKWRVKAGVRVGPGPNDFSDSPENVWTDDKGYLHLAITKVAGKWRCAEVVADRSLGFGEYRWVVAGDLPALDRQVVLGLFTYESDSREIDFELSRWGDAAKVNAQFVVQPYTIKGNMHRFDTGKATILTCSLLWEKGQVRGRCWAGDSTAGEPLGEWLYTGRSIPPAGKERVRANLWLFEGRAPASAERQEVVIRSFEFKPSEAK